MDRGRKGVLAAALALGVAGGCGDPLDEARWNVSPLFPAGRDLAVGDTVTIEASASQCELVVCPGVTSAAAPARFRWQSRTPAVVEVGQDGLLRGRSVGAGQVAVTFLGTNGGQTTEFAVAVVPPVAALAAQFDRDTVRAGDTVRVTFRALDPAGRAVPGAAFRYGYAPQLVEPVPGSTAGGAGEVTVGFRTLAPGVAEFDVYRDYIRPGADLQVTARLVVRPPGP